ncbi:glycosyltransferase [Planctomicrobium piriforme]|nr:glycosyltransferase [Planctomicrobium piriforme]
MRILFISTTFPDAAAPARGTYNSALVRALQREHEVAVVSPRFFTEVYSRRGRKTFSAPAEMQRLNIPVDYPTSWYTPRLLQARYGDQMWWSVRDCVQRRLEAFRPDAVLSYWAHPDGDVGLRAAALAGVPSAVIVGGTDVLILPKLPHRGERVRQVLQKSDAVITVSEGLRKATCELQVPEGRVHTIYQGVEEHLFESTRTRHAARKQLGLSDEFAHLLWVGRIVDIKALPVLLTAATRLRDRGVKFKLHLIGDGPARAGLKLQASRLGLDSQVYFHGAIGHDQVPDWYRAADLTMLCSDSEGLPNVLRESLACGTPFVSTNVGSIHEIAQPEASLLTPPRDPDAFATAIESMLTPEAKQAAATYRPRGWADCARDTARLLQSLRDARAEQAKTAPLPRRPLQTPADYETATSVKTASAGEVWT